MSSCVQLIDDGRCWKLKKLSNNANNNQLKGTLITCRWSSTTNQLTTDWMVMVMAAKNIEKIGKRVCSASSFQRRWRWQPIPSSVVTIAAQHKQTQDSLQANGSIPFYLTSRAIQAWMDRSDECKYWKIFKIKFNTWCNRDALQKTRHWITLPASALRATPSF